MRQQSITVGLFSLGLGLLLHFWLIPSFISVPGNMARAVLSPAFWPEILAGMAVIAGLVVLVSAFRQADTTDLSDLANPNPPNLPAESLAQGESIDSQPLTGTEQPQEPTSNVFRLLAFVVAMALYARYLDYLGMALASVLMLLVSFFLLGERRLWLVLTVSVLLPLVLYAFFLHVAGVSIPQGELIRLP